MHGNGEPTPPPVVAATTSGSSLFGLPRVVSDLIGYATFAYVVGFVTLLANTAKYGLPVLEFVKPLNLWIGVFPTAVVIGTSAMFRKWKQLNPGGLDVAFTDLVADLWLCFLFLSVSSGTGFMVVASAIEVLRGREVIFGDVLKVLFNREPPVLKTSGWALGLAQRLEAHFLMYVLMITAIWLLIFFFSISKDRETPIADAGTKWSLGEAWRRRLQFWLHARSDRSSVLVRYVIAASTLAILSVYIWSIYPRLPQRYGFGRPTTVQVLADFDMLPLIPPAQPNYTEKVYLSVPVELLFKADAEYVLRCPSGNNKRILTVDAKAIKGIVWRNE